MYHEQALGKLDRSKMAMLIVKLWIFIRLQIFPSFWATNNFEQTKNHQ